MKALSASASGIAVSGLAILAVFGSMAAQSIDTKRVANEGVVAFWSARYADLKQSADAKAAAFKVEILKEGAKNAEIRKKAEAELRTAEAEIEQANSKYAHQRAEGEAIKLEGELENLKAELSILEKQMLRCYRPCQRGRGRAGRDGLDSAGCAWQCITNLSR